MEQEFVAFKRVMQTVLKRQSLHGPDIHLFCIELGIVAPDLLGSIHGGIGILQQRLVIFTILRVRRDANAACDVQFMFADVEGSRYRLENFLRNQGRFVFTPDFRQDQDEFVPTLAGYRVAFANAVGKAGGHLNQQRITNIVAEAVVDILEMVQIDEQYCQPAVMAM